MSGEESSSGNRARRYAKPEPLSLRSSFSATRLAESLHLPSSPTFSLDQLSVYARRASNSSINMMSASAAAVLQHTVSLQGKMDDEQSKNAKAYECVRATTEAVENTIKNSFNDASLGLYRVSEHIHRRVPQIVESKAGLRDIEQQVETANSDMKDARRIVEDLERIESFRHIGQMVKMSLSIVKEHQNRRYRT